MNVKAIFPIMMGSCAFIMPAGGLQFVRLGRYAPRPALGLTIGGVPGVLLAAFVVRELPLQTLRWLVLAVVVYTALAMLRTGLSAPATATEQRREATQLRDAHKGRCRWPIRSSRPNPSISCAPTPSTLTASNAR